MRFIVCFILIFISCSGTDNGMPVEDKVALTETIVYKKVTGVDDTLLSLDIYYNSETSLLKPVVFYVHGGGFVTGDKAHQLENKITLFRNEGYVFVSTNYRLSSTVDNELFYPEHHGDVASAIKWVYDNILEYGGDRNKIALLGHSAGAQIVSLLGTNENFLEQEGLSLADIKGVLSIDTEGYNVTQMVDEGRDVYINVFGTDESITNDASPILNVEDGEVLPKFFIAKRGNEQRVAFAEQFIETLANAGTDISQIEASQYTHQGINNAIGETGERIVTAPVIAFLQNCFADH